MAASSFYTISFLLTFSILKISTIFAKANIANVAPSSLNISANHDKPYETSTAFQIESNDNFFIKSVKKKDIKTKKLTYELNKHQEDAYNEIMNKIMDNQFLAMKIPPSLNNAVTATVLEPKIPISVITTTATIKDESEAQKLLDESTTSEYTGNFIILY